MTPERFWSKVDASGDCWEWTGGVQRQGYGITYVDGPQRVAHRWAWENLVGPVPDGLVLDHLCRNKRCVNPDHLEPITNRENILRGYGITARNARKTECIHGHPLSGVNLFVWRGDRLCRTCHRERQRRYDEAAA